MVGLAIMVADTSALLINLFGEDYMRTQRSKNGGEISTSSDG